MNVVAALCYFVRRKGKKRKRDATRAFNADFSALIIFPKHVKALREGNPFKATGPLITTRLGIR